MLTANQISMSGVALVFLFTSASSHACRKYDEREIRSNLNNYFSIILGKSAPSLFDFYRYHTERDSSEIDAELSECIRLFGQALEGPASQRRITDKCAEWITTRGVTPTTTASLYFSLLRKKLLSEGVVWKIEEPHVAKATNSYKHKIKIALVYPSGREVILEVTHPENECGHSGFIKIYSIEGKPPHVYLDLKNLSNELR